jgi:hypothetical protein
MTYLTRTLFALALICGSSQIAGAQTQMTITAPAEGAPVVGGGLYASGTIFHGGKAYPAGSTLRDEAIPMNSYSEMSGCGSTMSESVQYTDPRTGFRYSQPYSNGTIVNAGYTNSNIGIGYSNGYSPYGGGYGYGNPGFNNGSSNFNLGFQNRNFGVNVGSGNGFNNGYGYGNGFNNGYGYGNGFNNGYGYNNGYNNGFGGGRGGFGGGRGGLFGRGRGW